MCLRLRGGNSGLRSNFDFPKMAVPRSAIACCRESMQLCLAVKLTPEVCAVDVRAFGSTKSPPWRRSKARPPMPIRCYGVLEADRRGRGSSTRPPTQEGGLAGGRCSGHRAGDLAEDRADASRNTWHDSPCGNRHKA